MKQAPAVYVPTEPEGNGITLPTLLSLLAHGIVLGLLIYTYQQPELETPASIETTMVTPGELAEMQALILANRAATQAASGSNSATAEPTNNSSEQSITQSYPPNDPVFTRFDEPADRSLMITKEHQQRLLEQSEEYERNIARLAAELDATTEQERSQVDQDKQQELDKKREELESFRQLQNHPPRIEKPTRNDRNIEINTGSGSTGESISITAGESTVSNTASGGSPNRSTGEFKNRIAEEIQQHLNAPQNTQGTTARVLLKLDARGAVLSAKASGANPEVNAAAERAAFAASPLPIDLNNPNAFRELVVNVTVK
ncbi:TonB C-terminal domain-containing protein [Psychrobacter jeotgali]|uniref:TonB C-terminal domain-containing protein n=1 Tax=Psychrobacter jeotgali TaxID=179010 RepID=UPI00191A41B1|nr:TonB C-terminal domain-containing protein [Psychrobacter jeotgali]